MFIVHKKGLALDGSNPVLLFGYGGFNLPKTPEFKIDPTRLAQEAAIAATRADVQEELERLAAHAVELRTLLTKPEPAGRRLDFLSQELTREANTLCSKSADLELTRIGLDMKTVVDQIKEQAANVE